MPSSLFQPGYTLTIGGQQWTQQILRLDLSLAAAPSLDCLAVAFPFDAPVDAAPGDPVDLTLASGEKEQAVFSGALQSIRHTADAIHLRVLNAGGVLAQVRPAVTWEQVTAGSVIRNLCDDAGVDAGDIADGVSLAYYAADPSRSSLDHIARVAAWSGALARVSADNRVDAILVNATQADIAFQYGRDLKSLEMRAVPTAIDSFSVAGESGAGDTSSPDALRPTTDFFAGSRPDGPSKGNRWRSEPALRTADGAASAAAAVERLYKAGRQRGSFTAVLQPDLLPGAVIEIQEAPAAFPSGPFWITRVAHRLGPQGAVTRAWFLNGGDAFDPTALLGSLGGLL